MKYVALVHCSASDQFNAPAQCNRVQWREQRRGEVACWCETPRLGALLLGLLGSGGVLAHLAWACFPPAQLATWLEDQLNLNTIADD